MAEIIFYKDFPVLLRETVSVAINDFSWLFPVWLQRLYVGFHPDEEDASAYMTIEKDYRFANLKVCGHWVSESSELQKEQILHEILHLYNAPLKNAMLDAIDTLCDGTEGKLYKTIKRELVGKNEAATADLTYAIMNRFNESKGNLQN